MDERTLKYNRLCSKCQFGILNIVGYKKLNISTMKQNKYKIDCTPTKHEEGM